MRRNSILGIILIVIILTSLITLFYNKDTNIDKLWKNTVSKYIIYDLWDDINSYDAGHTLLVPMYYAFSNKDKSKIEQFHNLFSCYAKYLEKNNYEYEYWNLNHMQFNFLASNYVNLCSKYDDIENIPEVLLDYLYDEAFYYCKEKREIYKKEENPNYNAFVAIQRDFALGKPIADLYQYHLVLLLNLKEFSDNGNYILSIRRNEKTEEALSILNTIYEEGVQFIDEDRWLMSVGAWDDYEDFAYMQYNTIVDGMVPSSQENTTWDTSHFARVPIFLQIIKRANKGNSQKVEYYNKLIEGLNKQFKEVVLVKPDNITNYYRTTNYMDGRNGLYRYNYKTQKNTGYQSYELSGTLFIGWWIFLGDDIKTLYREIGETFPLSQDAINTYVGPNTTRERNEYVMWPNYFNNGFAELICLTSSKLKIEEIFD